MREFDYEAAWIEVARPAFEALPPTVTALLARVVAECGDLHQGSDLSVIWPTTAPEGLPKLRAAFEALPSADLALAARVIYFAGHWHPGGVPRLVPNDGASWKFTNYADQVLRARFGLGSGYRDSNGWSRQIHDGAIRICYSNPHMWTWEEVAPATEDGSTDSALLVGKLSARERKIHRGWFQKRAAAASEAFDAMKARGGSGLFPAGTWVQFANTGAYMRDEHDPDYTPNRKRREAEARAEHQRQAEREQITAVACQMGA